MTSCRYVARDLPRALAGRHLEECAREGCTGCQPCTEPHCRICGREHAEGTCAECTAETRGTLHEIGRLCGSLSAEVRHRGIEGEAMMLLGPVADPEAIGHVQASIAAGRLPADYLDHADHELHPLFVLGTWDMIWRDALEHDESSDRLTITAAIDYLDRQLTYMAGFEHVPFEDFARQLRECRTHVERVLHDGEQIETGAPCMKCRVPLQLVRGERDDRWYCPRCRQESTEAQYRLAVRDDYEVNRERFEYLPMADCVAITGAKRGSISGWASKGLVRKRRAYEKVVYCVGDIRNAQGGEVLATAVEVP